MPTLPAARPGVDTTAAAPARVARIVSLGTHLPAGILSNAAMESLVDTSDSWIQERTGIRERRRIAPGQTVTDMGATAARVALERAGHPRVDALIVATCSGEGRLPAVACLVQRELGLDGVPSFDINAACTGFIYGLVLADSLVRSGTAATVLLVSTEALTTMVDYTDRATCVLFGDGAAAVVISAGDRGGVRAVRWAADGADADLISFGPPASDPQGRWAVRMSGRGTYRVAVERLTETAQQLCADAGWTGADIDWFAPHQANLRIIEAVARRLGIPMERVLVNVDRVGNTSAASVPLVLAEADRAGLLRPGHRVLTCAFGSGATWGGAALEWTAGPDR